MKSKWQKYFEPSSKDPFKLSRSKIDLYMECQRCFYLDRRLGVSRPRGPAFTLNVAVDALLKKEFDIHRNNGTSHPLMKKYGIKAVPYMHPELDNWRENFVGVQTHHKKTNLIIFGAIDDVWVDDEGSLMVVDYKATSKEGDIKALTDTKWERQYKRQMEIYQWLLRQNGHKVSDTGYFVYVNGKKDREAFDGKLEFDVSVISHTGRSEWVEGVINEIRICLSSDKLPEQSSECEFCNYRTAAGQEIQKIYAARTVSKRVKVAVKLPESSADTRSLF